MHRVAAVPHEVLPLGPRHDEGVQLVVGHQRAHGVHSRPAVPGDGPEKGEPDPELVEQASSVLGKLRARRTQLSPTDHGAVSSSEWGAAGPGC